MVLNMARSGNLLLGNRMQNKFGKQWKMCPGCRITGQDGKLDERHMILRGPLVASTQWWKSLSTNIMVKPKV